MTNIITIKNNAKIIDNKYVIKKKKREMNSIFNYLLSRSFNYFPKITKEEDDYIYYEYINDLEEPKEQKIIDLIILVSILHQETTIYKEIDKDYYKIIFEKTNNLIDNTYKYYNTIMDNIDTSLYPSPSEYLIARNISMIYNALNYSKENINEWYNLVKNTKKVRLTTIHNNLKLSHYIKNEKPYLISWDKTSIDIPIYDLINLYKNHYLDFNFIDIFNIYLKKYPLTKEEIILFSALIAIPNKITKEKEEYKTVINTRKVIDYVYKTNELLKEYGIKEKTNKNQEFNK